MDLHYIRDCKNGIESFSKLFGDSKTLCEESLQVVAELLTTVERLKTAVESTLLLSTDLPTAASLLNCKVEHLEMVKNKLVNKTNIKKIPAEVFAVKDSNVEFLTAPIIANKLGITIGTFQRWRRNWKIEGVQISFPPPNHSKLGVSEWTNELVDWWIDNNKDKVYLKGFSDRI